jgi:protein-L-isoaspartate(D-aspartate) O-methyltransferase
MRDQQFDARLMRFVLDMRQAGVTDSRVLSAMERTPRAAFAPEHMEALALDDIALPLACGQVMTKPSLVGRMVSALNLTGPERVLEIGCGSGYQTAVLARLCAKVVGLDRHAKLVTDARAALGRQRLDPAQTALADGLVGYTHATPFDRIIANGTLNALPQAWLDQAALGGMIVAPLFTDRGQRLMKWTVQAGGVAGAPLDLGPIDFAPLSANPVTPNQDCSGP